MEETEIEIISKGDRLEDVARILQNFLQNNANAFTFTNLSENNRRLILWTALFQHLQTNASQAVHSLCLASIRLLSRDKTDLENLICEKWIIILIEKAGLYNFSCLDEESMMSMDLKEKDTAVEAMKSLCNITFNSEVSRALCAHTEVAQGLIARLRVYKENPYKDDLMLFDMKLLFILTALRQDIKMKVRDELHGMDYLISCLNEIVAEACAVSENASSSSGMVEGGQHCFLSDTKQAIVCEILKAQFNLIMHSGFEDLSESEEAMYLKLMPVLTSLLYAHTSTQVKMFELHNNIANLLTSVPPTFYPYLTPALNSGESSRFTYSGQNMDALQSLVQLLEHRLAITANTKNQYENLSPIMTVMNKCARGCRFQRKYLRQVVLPPLRDVSQPPEQGNTLRNQLCRLLTTPVTSIRDLVAEFVFILCKEKVGRMVKYTGFGNAAGHLAQQGLLGEGSASRARYSSSSSDSDTEEYRRAHPHIDPVRGCTRPPPTNPFEGMTDEQKEYEAMKLVNLFDKMVTEGIVRPARVGPDGRPQAVEHVLELREHPPNRPQS